MRNLVPIVIIFGLFLVYSPNLTRASFSSCTATVTPNDSQPNVTEKSFSFTITNTDSVNMQWFKISAPLSGTTIGPVSLASWEKTPSGNAILFTQNSNSPSPLVPGQSLNPTLGLNVGDVGGQSGNWSVQASDSLDGSNPANCNVTSGGSLALAISTTSLDTTPPGIADLTVSNITSGSATVSWTTNEPATAVVNYGLEYSGPEKVNDSTLQTNHSLTLTSAVGATTTYYYNVCSLDATGNQTCTTDNTFTTGSATSTGTATTIVNTTTTTTNTVTQTVTKIVKDTTLPAVALTTKLDKPFPQGPEISGRASDDSGIAKVDFSVDGGDNWLPVDNIVKPFAKSTDFSFLPIGLVDGDYAIMVRATDSAGNVAVSAKTKLVIDRLPPQVGLSLYNVGPLVLPADQAGRVFLPQNLNTKITASAVGGPVTVNIFAGGKAFPLTKNSETGLWEGQLNLTASGEVILTSQAVDGANNTTSGQLGKVVVVSAGQTAPGARITVWVWDALGQSFVSWQGAAFGQSNPVVADAAGKYRLLLPPGRYYLDVTAAGKRRLMTTIFEVKHIEIINSDLKMQPLTSWWSRFWPLQNVPVQRLAAPDAQPSAISGQLLPFFSFPTTIGAVGYSTELRGRTQILSVLTTWAPGTAEQLQALQQAEKAGSKVTVIMVQEPLAKITVWQLRGGYSLPIWVDADGKLLAQLGLTSVPTHYFLDRKGLVTKIYTGFLTADEINSNF